MKSSRRFALLFTIVVCGCATAEEIQVAVASNFKDPMRPIIRNFEAKTNHKVILIIGSTGKLYAQIKNGAPFDIFFAADVERPKLLEQEGLAAPGTRVTYAYGKLVLWSLNKHYSKPLEQFLQGGEFHYLAIANPKLAPYGQAARDVLDSMQLWERFRDRIVRGENIGQTFQFVKSGNAELGFVAYSQIKSINREFEGAVWQVPNTLYTPIEQQAVLLKPNQAALALLRYVRSAEAVNIIHQFGYDTPDA